MQSVMHSRPTKLDISMSAVKQGEPKTPGVSKSKANLQGSRLKSREASIGSKSRHTVISYKEAMTSEIANRFRKQIERKVSGLDLLNLKAQNREFVKKSEQIFDKNERLTFIKSQLKKLEPDNEIEHMFVNENALSDR